MMNRDIKPEVGMGVTECLFTDSHSCTISRVSSSLKTIWYKRDKCEVIAGSCADGSAVYGCNPNPEAYEQKATLRKDGKYRATGTNFFIKLGIRYEYYDPSF